MVVADTVSGAPAPGLLSRVPLVGVLGLQGGVREHTTLVESIAARAVQIRKPEDLVGPDGARVDALILPGGESSVIDRLTRMFGLDAPLKQLIAQGLPTLGTCAGLILLARHIENPAPGQQSLGVLNITVNRNAFGPQVESSEALLETGWGPIRAAFIRAPQIVSADAAEARVMARLDGAIVGVEQGNVLGVSFHPELTGDTLLHRRLLSMIT